MTKEDNFYVAIELGSSKISAIVGNKRPDDTISILAFAQESSEQFIRKGRINNVLRMNTCIGNIKKTLEDKLQKRISGAYVGIGGMGMHTISNTVVCQLGDKVLITPEMVRNVEQSNNCAPGGDREILGVITQNYKLGTQTVTDPVGITADSIEGHFLNIIASSAVTNDGGCFQEAGIRVIEKPISVLTLADAILPEPEKRSGCVFVDMGAETTSVAVYKNNILRHLAVIPLGGNNINRDLCSTFQIENDEAEMLKRKYGSAVYCEDADEHEPIVLKDGRTKKYEEFSGLVAARMEEIIENINNQIKLSNYDKSQLIAGLVITGGAANIQDIAKAFADFTGFEKVRFVKNINLQYVTESKNAGGFNADGSYNTVIAMVNNCTVNCCGGDINSPNMDLFVEEQEPEKPADPEVEVQPEVQEPEPEEEKKIKKPGMLGRFFTRAKKFAEGMVSDNEDELPTEKR